MSPRTLSVIDAAKHFSGVVALDGVSLELGNDEILGLIGPNGSGKTTLLNVASGLLRPTDGRVEIGGHDATGFPSHRFARLGVGRTFQQIRLFAGMTVEENLVVGSLAGGANGDIAELLNQMALTEVRERDAATLPYGQQRRVEIARALAGSPRFLLLDEPGAGLNEIESDELLMTIRRVREQRECAVLIVDHDLRLIMRLCERIHVLADGRTISEGKPEEVRRDRAVIDAYLGSELHHSGVSPEARESGRQPEEEVPS
jgi:ABC-type branched-subunit amino acid transport system ATPase component